MSGKLTSILLSVTAKASVAPVSPRILPSLAHRHLAAAAMFSRKVGEIETQNAGQQFSSFWEELFSCACASVIMTVTSLEAYINEIYFEKSSRFTSYSAVLEQLWGKIERLPIKEKFDLALAMKECAIFNTGSGPAQEMLAVVALRNALVHFQPEWLDEQQVHAQVSKRLNGYIKNSRFFPRERLFPRAWATHECTRWAFCSCVAFVREFENRTGISGANPFGAGMAP